MVTTAKLTGATVERMAARIPAMAIPPTQGETKEGEAKRAGRTLLVLEREAGSTKFPVLAIRPSKAVKSPKGAIRRLERREALLAVAGSLAEKIG